MTIADRIRRPAGRCVLLLLSGLFAWPAFSAERQSGPFASGLVWVRFNSRAFCRPREVGWAERVHLDTGTTFKDYSQIFLGFIEIPADEEITFNYAGSPESRDPVGFEIKP